MGCVHGISISSHGADDSINDGWSRPSDQQQRRPAVEFPGHRRSGRIRSLDPAADDLIEGIRRSPELLSLIRSYLKEVDGILKLLSELRACFTKAVDKGAIIYAALSVFEQEEQKGKAPKKRERPKRYAKTLAKLVEFRTADDPFAAVDSGKLRAACEKLQAMMAELRDKKHDLDGRLASKKRWRKVWKAAYTLVVIAALAVSVVLAAVAMPAAAVAGATAAATGIKAVEYWFDTMWDEKEKGLEEEREAVQTMRRAALLEVQDLETVRAMAEKVSVGIGAIRNLVEFALGGEAEAVKVAMVEIRRKVAEVEGGLMDLKHKVDVCDAEVNKVAVEFLNQVRA